MAIENDKLVEHIDNLRLVKSEPSKKDLEEVANILDNIKPVGMVRFGIDANGNIIKVDTRYKSD